MTPVVREKILNILPNLRRFAFALTGSKHDADDLLQATVEKLLLKECPEDIELQKWAFRVCRNQWIDEVRKQKVRLASEYSDIELPVDNAESERQLLSRITLREVNAAMNKLPDKQRIALSMASLGGLTYTEISETLDVPIGTVMSRISRARKYLASQFGGEDPSIDLLSTAPGDSRELH